MEDSQIFIILILSISIVSPIPVFAQTEDQLQIEDRINNFIEWFFDWLIASNENSQLDETDKTDRGKALEDTKEYVTSGTKWYFTGHRTTVSWINSEAPIPLDAGLVALASIIIMVVIIGVILKEHIKHALIIIIVIGSIIAGLVLFNINFSI